MANLVRSLPGAMPTGPLADKDGEITPGWRYLLMALRARLGVIGVPAFNVKDPMFGAQGDDIADDTAPIQAAIIAALATGGEVFFPPGSYVVSGAGLAINQTLTTYGLGRITIRGSGRGNTRLRYTGTAVALTYNGNVVSAGIVGLFKISDIQLFGPGTSAQAGLKINIAAYFTVMDVEILQFTTGTVMVDTLSCAFYNTANIFCTDGVTSAMGVFSPPNAISFFNCVLGSNTRSGATITGSATFSYVGGSIESNGLPGGGWGVQLIGAGIDGGVGCAFNGVYFENNANQADVLITHSALTGCVYDIIGCLFNRNLAQFVTSDIVLNGSAGNGAAMLNVQGCGFRGFSGYVPSAARPYIKVNAGGQTNIQVTALGNFYSAPVEKPVFFGPVVTPDAIASAWVNFAVSGGVITGLSGSYNVASVTRTSAGVYGVTFEIPLASASYLVIGSALGSPVFANGSGLSTTGFTLTVVNSALAAVDPFNVYVVCYGAAPF